MNWLLEQEKNLANTIIIPLGLLTVPQWVHAFGCKISALGKIQRYLDVPIGYHLKQSDMHNFCLDKISKHIFGWSNKLLSFIWKILLIENILQSITTYHKMYMATPKSTVKQVSRLFKDLLWGFVERLTNKRLL